MDSRYVSRMKSELSCGVLLISGDIIWSISGCFLRVPALIFELANSSSEVRRWLPNRRDAFRGSGLPPVPFLVARRCVNLGMRLICTALATPKDPYVCTSSKGTAPPFYRFGRGHRTSYRHALESPNRRFEPPRLLRGYAQSIAERATLRLHFTHQDHELDAVGRVVHSQPNMGMGIQFAGIVASDPPTLDRRLAELALRID
jgi:hypothetical protein